MHNGRLFVALSLLASLWAFPSASHARADAAAQTSEAQNAQQVQEVEPSAPSGAPESSSATDPAGEPLAQPQAASSISDTSSPASPVDPSTGKPLDQHFVRTFASDFFHDEYHVWTGPFHAHNYDSHTMKKYGLPFLLISVGLIASDRQTARWLPNTTNQVIWSGRVSQIGAPYTLAGFAGVYYGIGRATGNEHARETGFLALEALAESQFVALVLKEVTQRQRPVANKIQRDGFWKGGDSFPSGHAMGSFAVASVFAYEYRDHIAVPITAYSLATIVDLSRFGARAHWYSDVFVGSSMGFLIGRYAYKTHHDPDLPGSPVPRRVSRLRPSFRAGEQGVGLYWDL